MGDQTTAVDNSTQDVMQTTEAKMPTLEDFQKLSKRVDDSQAFIATLKDENAELRGKLGELLPEEPTIPDDPPLYYDPQGNAVPQIVLDHVYEDIDQKAKKLFGDFISVHEETKTEAGVKRFVQRYCKYMGIDDISKVPIEKSQHLAFHPEILEETFRLEFFDDIARGKKEEKDKDAPAPGAGADKNLFPRNDNSGYVFGDMTKPGAPRVEDIALSILGHKT